MLDDAGFPDAIISASSDLDENLIFSLKTQGAQITSWGVGTNLIIAKDCPSFGGVYKLVAMKNEETGEFTPKIKISENIEKITNPGNKTVFRLYSKETGKIIGDLIAMADEKYSEDEDILLFDPMSTWKQTLVKAGTFELRELLVPIFQKGVCVYDEPTVPEITENCAKELDTLWDETRRLVNPNKVYVDLSKKLYKVKKDLLDAAAGIDLN
jgi:nicotinate phosphoribosyltransferase